MRKIILNETFGIVVLAIVLIPQIAHTVYVFEANSHEKGVWYHWCYAVGIDLAILIFTVKGWPRTAALFFVGTLAHNVAYQFAPESMFSALLTSTMLSATILAFSHLFFRPKEFVSPEEFANPADRADQRFSDAPSTPPDYASDEVSEESLQHSKLLAALSAGVRVELQPYRCPACGDTFSSAKKLNGHVSSHKQHGEWSEEEYGDWKEANIARKTACGGITSSL